MERFDCVTQFESLFNLRSCTTRYILSLIVPAVPDFAVKRPVMLVIPTDIKVQNR